MTLKFDGWPWKTIGHLFYTTSCFVHSFKAMGKLKLELQSGKTQFGSKSGIFFPCDLEIWQMTTKNNGHLFYTTSSFVHHFKSSGELKLELQSGNAKFGSKLANFLSHVTLKCDRPPWIIIRHLFYAASNFVHHFKAISEFKMELQSRNTKFGSKSIIFLSRATLKFGRWPWKTIGHHFCAT